MEGFIQELGSKKVLSREDIALLKEYIGKKYMNYLSSQKSNMLANAIYQVLDKNIQGLSIKHSQIIKKDLLKNTILKNGEPILLIDIFNIYLTMEDKSNEFLEGLINWINLNVENKVTKGELEKYIFKFNTLNNNDFADPLTEENMQSTVDDDFVKAKTENGDVIEVNNKSKQTLKNVTEFYAILTNYNNWKTVQCLYCFFLVVIMVSQNGYKINNYFENAKVKVNINSSSSHIVEDITFRDSENNKAKVNPNILLTATLPQHFKYKDINQALLKKFLVLRNSLLAEEPYFSTIISVSKEYNLNPLVIFAIAGQEQSFVPKGESSSIKIANNPFNVYHSWMEYNTDINDSSRIVCGTVIKLSEGRPQDEEPFHWINKKYAEDKNWSNSVSKIYNKLEENNKIQ